MVSFGTNIGGFAPNWAMINNWFNRKKGRAMGFGMAAQAAGGVLLAPLVAILISSVGWRFAAIFAGIALLVVVLPFATIIRTRPSDMGLLPDGDKLTANPSNSDLEQSRSSEITHFTVRQVTQTPAFWTLNLAMGLRQFAQSGMIFHFSPLLQDRGFTVIMSGSTVGLLAFMGIGGAIVGGWISDRYERRRVMALIVFGESLALTLLLIATSTWQVYVFVLIYGFGGGAHALNRAILGEYFGQEHYAKIWGVLSMVTTPLAAAGPIFTGGVFDYFGNYDIAIATFVAVYAVSSGAYFICRKPELNR
jgi:sugar phosphate permease